MEDQSRLIVTYTLLLRCRAMVNNISIRGIYIHGQWSEFLYSPPGILLSHWSHLPNTAHHNGHEWHPVTSGVIYLCVDFTYIKASLPSLISPLKPFLFHSKHKASARLCPCSPSRDISNPEKKNREDERYLMTNPKAVSLSQTPSQQNPAHVQSFLLQEKIK